MTGMGADRSMRDRYLEAATFEEFVAGASANAALWQAMAGRVVPDEWPAAVAAVGGRWHLLVLTEDWCGDAVNSLPVLAALARKAPNLDLRIVSRDGNPDLMDSHLTGTSRSVPVVIVLDAEYVERAWWGPRPGPLQRWVLGEGRTLSAGDRYREMRRWYARDRGATIVAELLAALQSVSGAVRRTAS